MRNRCIAAGVMVVGMAIGMLIQEKKIRKLRKELSQLSPQKVEVKE